jgi:hypothetical protein
MRSARLLRAPAVLLIWVDGGYANVVDTGRISWAAGEEQFELVVVPRNADVRGSGAAPSVGRGTDLRLLAKWRRLARDYERKTAHGEAMIDVAIIRLMAARLAGEDVAPSGPIETGAARRLAKDLNENKSPTGYPTPSQAAGRSSTGRGRAVSVVRPGGQAVSGARIRASLTHGLGAPSGRPDPLLRRTTCMCGKQAS